MTFVTFTNVLVMMLCVAVLVQSVRLQRSFRNFSDGDLKSTVSALDQATGQARAVLSDLKDTLRTDCAATARTLAEAETLREELTMMIGIANAVAERIVETVDQNGKPVMEPIAAKVRKRPSAQPAAARRIKSSAKPTRADAAL